MGVAAVGRPYITLIENMNPILKTENLTISFGGIRALSNVSFEVEKGVHLFHHRTEWSREDHHLQLHQWNLSAEFRKDLLQRRRHHLFKTLPGCQKGDCQDISKHRTFLSHEHHG